MENKKQELKEERIENFKKWRKEKVKGDYTAERKEKIEKLSRADFHEFLRERGEMNENNDEPFDYTKWQKDLFDDMSVDELSEKAMEYVNGNK